MNKKGANLQKTINSQMISWITNRRLFTLVYFTIYTLWYFPLLGSYMDIASKVCFIWGAILIAWDLLKDRTVFKAPFGMLVIAFLASYVMTILFNLDGNVYMNIKHLIYNGILLLLIYEQDAKKDKAYHLKTLCIMNDIIVYITLLAGIVSLVMFLFNVSFEIQQGATSLRQGFVENRLFGVYTSPNTGALFGIISIAAGCINSAIRSGRIFQWKAIYIVNVVVQFAYYTLGLSNGGLVTLAVFIFVFIFVFIYPILCNFFSRLHVWKKMILGIVLGLVIFAAVIGSVSLATTGLRQVFLQAENSIQNLLINDENPSDDRETSGEIVLERIESGDDLSNGRLTIWDAGRIVWMQRPLFGLGDADIYNDNGELTIPVDTTSYQGLYTYWMKRANGNLHNIFIQILVCTGAIGFTIFLVFACLVARRYIKFLLKKPVDAKMYKIIGMLFCILAAIVANGLFETHLLFDKQDPYGVIFWAYLGIGLLLIEKQRKAVEHGYFAFACDTPYQICGAVNFVAENMENSAGVSDIFIYHQFAGSQGVSDRLRQSGLFNNVYDIMPYHGNKVWYAKLRTFWRLLAPRHTLHVHTMGTAQYDTKGYSNLVLFFFTSFTHSLRQVFSDAQVLMIEDGTGSYFGNVETDYRTGLFRFYNRFFMNGALDYHPQRLYVNNPSICSSTVTDDIRALPKLDENNSTLKVIEGVFDYRDNLIYNNKPIVYLTQPLDEVKGSITGAHETLLETLWKYRKKTIVRIHPRQNNVDTDGLAIDEINNLWELECTHHITDNHILIAAFSTAQLTPKLLSDAEPYLIFAYRLFFTEIDSEYWKGTETLIEKFRGLYRQLEKIYVPESMEELQKHLDTIFE